MNDSIKYLENIQTSFKKMKVLTIASMTLSGVVALGAVIGALWFASVQGGNIYVLDQGSVLAAHRSTNQAQRDLEVISHVTRFHELFFNVAPNINTINENTERAFQLADASARSYYNDLTEAKFYSHLIQINATQQISVDSVAVDMNVLPYKVTTYAHRYLIREASMTQYNMISSCEILETPRSSKNPHGLMITKFFVENDEPVQTRKR